MNKDQITHLLKQYLKGTLDQEGQDQLKEALEDGPAFREVIEKLMAENKEGPEWRDARLEQMVQGILNADKIGQPAVIRKVSFRNWTRVAAAAVIVLMLSVGGYFYFKGSVQQGQSDLAVKKDVEPPKGTKASIILANGQTVLLDSISNGTIATQGDVAVIKNANGEIVYSGNAAEIKYNTLNNPRGSEVVNLTLQDGTKVWLNAESSLKFPVAFVGNERIVEITGEAYFEVSKNAAKKFLVNANGVTTEVLGTHFNVNSYTDEEAFKVTLLEGSVRVSTTGNKNIIIKPGQQALAAEGKLSANNSVNVDEVMAWKNGLFSFNKANIKTVMKQLARWYDVEVVFEAKVPQQLFGGEIQRNIKLSKVLESLEKNGVHFRIEEKKIVVL